MDFDQRKIDETIAQNSHRFFFNDVQRVTGDEVWHCSVEVDTYRSSPMA
jgi:hypothetical protein